MAHTRKDTLVESPEWWDHLRPFGKRQVAKSERRAAKNLIRQEINDPDETPKGRGLHKPESTMRKLRYEKGESVIPCGGYCYDNNGRCPYWDWAENHEEQNNGFCWFIGKGDWFGDGCGLLWDQCKECGVNEPDTMPEEGSIQVWD